MASTQSHSSANAQENAVTIVGATMIVLAVISVVLRFYTRYRMKTALWWDDWMALTAVLTAVAAGVLVLAASLVDPDAAWLLTESDPNYTYTTENQKDLQLSFVADCLYFSVVCAAKTSLLLMYNRIFRVSRSFKIQATVVGVFIIIFWYSTPSHPTWVESPVTTCIGPGDTHTDCLQHGKFQICLLTHRSRIATTFATIFNCWPIEWSWLNSLSPAPYCINYNVFWLIAGIIEAVFDVIIIILPVKQVMDLQLSLQKKLAVMSVFLLGACGIVTGIVKVVEGWAPGKRSPHWDKTEIWSSVHAAMGILCACLPVCWPLIARRASINARRTTVYSKGRWRTWLYDHKPSLSWSWASDTKGESRHSTRDDRLDIEALPLDEYCVPPSPDNSQLQLVPFSNAQIRVERSIQVDVEYAKDVRGDSLKGSGTYL